MHPADEHFRKLERMYAAAPVNAYFRPELKISEGKAELTIPVRPEFFHSADAVHGAIYFKAMDDAAFFAVNSLVTDVFVLTVTYNVYLTRPVTAGTLHAVGRVVHKSRQLFIADAELLNGDGKQVGRGTGSFMRSPFQLASIKSYA
jgi:uncharacterized protein (TIGR00369 family)